MQYYTLDDASKKLGLGVDEFRKRLATEWKTLRRFPDGATLRFQARDIDELARKIGRSSDPDLQVGEAPLSLAEEPGPAITKKKPDETLFLPTESDDDFVPLAVDDGSAKPTKTGSDSDVKLEKTAGGTVRPVAGGDEPTEMINVPKAPLKSFDLRADEGKKKTRVTSEFELSLNAGDDDFNLDLNDDSDEIQIGKSARKGARGPDSGINLADPADSGISLEKDSSEFELSLEPDAVGPKTPMAKSGPKTPPVKGGPKTTPPVAAVSSGDADSEFELSLDDGSDPNAAVVDSGDQKDIFETDFELPAIDDSSSEEAATGSEESDFDLSIDDDSSAGEDSASEVVAIEEEAVEEDLEPIVDETEAEPVRAMAAPAAPVEWGPLPVIALIPCTFVMFFVGLMGFELLNSMWGFSSPNRGAGPIVKMVAGLFGEVKD
jgi:hypothetical protein